MPRAARRLKEPERRHTRERLFLGDLERLGEAGLLERLAVIIGVGPIVSARSARWMDANLFGVSIPASVVERLDNADDEAAEGQRICVELIEAYRDMPGIAGVHIMAPAQGPARVAAVLDALG